MELRMIKRGVCRLLRFLRPVVCLCYVIRRYILMACRFFYRTWGHKYDLCRIPSPLSEKHGNRVYYEVRKAPYGREACADTLYLLDRCMERLRDHVAVTINQSRKKGNEDTSNNKLVRALLEITDPASFRLREGNTLFEKRNSYAFTSEENVETKKKTFVIALRKCSDQNNLIDFSYVRFSLIVILSEMLLEGDDKKYGRGFCDALVWLLGEAKRAGVFLIEKEGVAPPSC